MTGLPEGPMIRRSNFSSPIFLAKESTNAVVRLSLPPVCPHRRRRDIDVHGLRHRCKRNNPLLLSWAYEAQSLVSADLIHGSTVAARGAGAHRARPTLQAPCLPATWGRPVLASAADFFLEWCRNRLRGDAVVPSQAVRLLFLPRSHLPAEIPSSCRRRCRDVSHSKSAGPSPV